MHTNAAIEFIRRHKIELAVFVLAVFLWAYVKTEEDYDWVFDVPIDVVGIQPGMTLENDVPSHARVRFRGRGKSLIALGINRDFAVFVDGSGGQGDHTVELSVDNVSIARQGGKVEVLDLLSPKEIQIVLASIYEKRVPVVSRVQIQTLDGYAVIGDVLVDPDSVLISGPEGLVRGIDEWYTEPETILHVNRDVRRRVALQASANPRLVLENKEVTVLADVQKLMERILEGVPVEVRNVPAGWKAIVVPSKLSLTLEGGDDILTRLRREEIVAYIDYRRQRDSASKDYPAYIETPEGVSHRDVTPQRFKVVLEKK